MCVFPIIARGLIAQPPRNPCAPPTQNPNNITAACGLVCGTSFFTLGIESDIREPLPRQTRRIPPNSGATRRYPSSPAGQTLLKGDAAIITPSSPPAAYQPPPRRPRRCRLPTPFRPPYHLAPPAISRPPSYVSDPAHPAWWRPRRQGLRLQRDYNSRSRLRIYLCIFFARELGPFEVSNRSFTLHVAT